MANLMSMSLTQLESLKRELLLTIDNHNKKTIYQSSEKQHTYILKRLQTRLDEVNAIIRNFNK